MKDQVEFPESLGRAFEHIKALHMTLASVMLDVAALRHMVLKTATLNNKYRRELTTRSVKTRAMITAAMREYDEEIERLKGTGLRTN